MAVDNVTQRLINGAQATNSVVITSAAAPAVNSDQVSYVDITAQAVDFTSMTTGLTGTPVDGQLLVYRIKDNGSARAIVWGASFVDYRGAGTPALPSTTVAGKRMTASFRYDATASKYGLIALAQE